jgi:hypothetical protein
METVIVFQIKLNNKGAKPAGFKKPLPSVFSQNLIRNYKKFLAKYIILET